MKNWDEDYTNVFNSSFISVYAHSASDRSKIQGVNKLDTVLDTTLTDDDNELKCDTKSLHTESHLEEKKPSKMNKVKKSKKKKRKF